MANTKIINRNVRKITRVGKTSLAVTLPVEMLTKLGWREKQKVVIRQKGNQLIIKDWKQ